MSDFTNVQVRASIMHLVRLSVDVLGRWDSVQEVLELRATLQTSNFTKYAPGQAVCGRPRVAGFRAGSPRTVRGSDPGFRFSNERLYKYIGTGFDYAPGRAVFGRPRAAGFRAGSLRTAGESAPTPPQRSGLDTLKPTAVERIWHI